MDAERLIEKARAAMGERKRATSREKGYIFHHGLRTARIAMNLAKLIGEPVERHDLLFAAALFHDIGKGIKPHNEVGAKLAADLLTGECPADDLVVIARIIREHNRRKHASQCLVASRILQDADVLDHYGAQNVWLAFHWCAAHDESPQQCLAFFQGEDYRRDVAESRESLNFDVSRRLFDNRVAFERGFFDRFAREIDGELLGA